jgi:hypothetical protein
LAYYLLALYSMLFVTVVNLMKMTDHRWAIFQKPISMIDFVPSSCCTQTLVTLMSELTGMWLTSFGGLRLSFSNENLNSCESN